MSSERRPLTPALKRVVVGISFFLLTMAVAVIGYVSFGWNWLDAFYMYVITVFGVGYGEVRPLITPEQRIFNMIVIVAGSASAIYTVGAILQMFTEGEIKRLLDVQRAARDISKLNRHVIVCGFGRIGQVMAQELTHAKTPFVILDVDEQRISLAEKLGYLAYLGSAAEEAALRVVGIDRAIALATVLPNDTMNVFITLTARHINAELLILSRANLPATEAKLRMAGADHVVLPTRIGATQMANLIRRPRGIDFLEQTGDRQGLNQLLNQIDVQLAELDITSEYPYVGWRLASLEVRGQGEFIIIGLRKRSGQLFPVRANPIMEVGDTLILLGHSHDTPKLVREVSSRGQVQYRGARG
ncbi:potassium channel family protein [Parathermosynechococcus lividus]